MPTQQNHSKHPQQVSAGARTAPRPPVGRWVDGAFLLAALLGPLLLYTFSMPTTVVLEDDGLFLMTIKHLGIAHPPGYPLYTLLGHLFVSLPGNTAVLGHLFSGLTMAGACALVYTCARLVMAGPWPALAGAWLFGASEHVWSQAIIAEVYALNALLFFAIYALLLRNLFLPPSQRAWLLAAGLFGLSLANHWPLMMLTAPGLLMTVQPVWRRLAPRLPLLAGLAVVSAALPYGWLIWRSQQDLIINFSGPINSLERIWHYLGRQDYTGVDVSAAAGWGDRLAFLGWFAQQVAMQLTIPGFALVLLGLAVLFRRRQWALLGSSVLVFMGNSVVLLLLLAFEFSDYQVAVFRPYPLVCFGLAAIWLAIGAQTALDRLRQHPPLQKRPGSNWTTRRLPMAIAAMATVTLTTSSVHGHWSRNNRSDSTLTRTYAELIFNFLPKDAILIVNGDTDTAPLGYFHFVENYRPDIRLVNAQGLIFNDRIYAPNLARRPKQEIFNSFIEDNERPLFFTGIGNLVLPHGVRNHGLIKEVIPGSDSRVLQLQHHPSVEHYYETLLTETPQDRWEQLVRNQFLFGYGQYLGLVILADEPGLLAQTENVRTLARTSFFSLMGMAEIFLEKGNQSHLAQAGQVLEAAESRRPTQLSAERASRFLYLKGFLRFQQGHPQEAVALFEESQRLYPAPDNSSLGALQQLKPGS